MRHIHLRDRQISPKVSLCFDQRLQDWQLTDDPKQVTCKHCRRIMERREQEKRGEMNKEEILTMEAGEELDRLVATEVMGEPIPEFTPENAFDLQLAGSPVKSPQGSWLCLCAYDEGDIPRWQPLHYSTDISAAWRAVEKVTEQRHCHCEINVYPDGLASVKFTKATGPFTPDEIFGWAGIDNDMTTPEAICKAALLAKQNKN